MAIVVGLDPGQSESTLAFMRGRRRQTVTMPSYQVPGSLAELARLRGGSSRDVHLHAEEHVLRHQGAEYFVGELAIAQDATARDAARGDTGRYHRGHTLRQLLALLGSVMGNARSQAVRVVTGLPVDVWTRELADQVEQSFLGEHQFSHNGQERSVLIERVLVMMEGAGALAHLGTADTVIQGVIDVGGGSTDLFMAHGQNPIMPRCGSLQRGVEAVGEQISALMHERYNRTLTARELRAVLRACATCADLPSIPVTINGRRQTVSIESDVTETVKAVGSSIGTFVGQKWGRAEDASEIFLVGGGAYLFADEIKRRLGSVRVSATPELDNVIGYLNVGLAIDHEW